MLYPTRPPDEDLRLAALRLYALLDTPPETAFDRLAGLAARVFDVPLALITLIDRDRQWFKACQGPASGAVGLREIARDIAFCAHTILAPEVLVAEDLRLDLRFQDNPLVSGDPHVRFYAGAPLMTADGQRLGTLCLLDFAPRRFSPQQQEALRDLAASVVSEMELCRAAASLSESERLYRQMFESSPQPIWVYDAETLRFLAVNDTAIAQYGYSREQFLSMTLCDIRPPEDAAAVRAAALQTGEGTRTAGIWRHRRQNGTLLWADIATHPFQFEGHPARLAVINDVTERRHAEEALRESEERFRTIAQATPVTITVTRYRDGAILYANDHFYRMFGLEASLPIAALDAADFYEEPTSRRELLVALGENECIHGYEAQLKKVNGDPFWVSGSFQRLKFQGEDALFAAYSDVTAQTRAQEQLRESEQRFREIAETLEEGFWVSSPDMSRFEYVSPACERIWGLNLADLAARPHAFLDVIHPEDRPAVLARRQQDNLHYSNEYRLLHPDGRIRWVRTRNFPVCDQGGAVLRLVGVCEDITERKQAEEALRVSERQFRDIAETVHEAFWVSSPDRSRVEYVSPAYERVWGLSCADFYADPLSFLVAVHPEDRADLLAKRREDNLRYDNEYRIIRPDGQLRWVRTRIFPVCDSEKTVLRLVGTSEDITERKQAELLLQDSRQRYKSLVQYHPYAVCSIDLDGRLLAANAACEHLTGYTEAEMQGQPLAPLVAPEYLAEAAERFGQAMQGQPQTTALAILQKEGRRVEVSLTTVPIVVDAATTGVYIIAKDITAEKALEDEREELLAQTESLLADALDRADHDHLTGLLNHRAFHKRLEEETRCPDPECAGLEGHPLALLLMDLDNFKFFNDVYGHLAGDDLLRQVAQALNCCGGPADTLARFGGDEFALLMPGATWADAGRMAEQVRAAIREVGYRPPGYDVPIPLSLSIGVACLPEDGATRLDVLEAADAYLRVAKSGGEEDGQALRLRRDMAGSMAGFSMLDALVTAVDNKDRYTRKHSEDVMAYSVEIAQELGMDARTLHTVEVAALLHDVGKIGVPDSILRKPGNLSEEEFAAIKQHPMMGTIIVGAVSGFEETLDAIRHHHERWDGKGYPFGLKQEETPLLARLMAVADAYSAMTTNRPYRKGMEAARAVRILEEGAGTQWDPACVAAFLRARGRSGE